MIFLKSDSTDPKAGLSSIASNQNNSNTSLLIFIGAPIVFFEETVKTIADEKTVEHSYFSGGRFLSPARLWKKDDSARGTGRRYFCFTDDPRPTLCDRCLWN